MNLVTSDFEELPEFILNDAHLANPITTEDLDLPDAPSLREAMSGPESDKWHHAILEELTAIKEVGTWELVDPSPAIQNIVGCHFILQKEHGADGNITKFKARLVTQGFSQWEGIDYAETFMPIIKSALLRVFLTISAHHGWRKLCC